MNNLKYLEPKFDGAKSFYKKAILDFDPAFYDNDTCIKLYSYGMLVATFDKLKNTVILPLPLFCEEYFTKTNKAFLSSLKFTLSKSE